MEESSLPLAVLFLSVTGRQPYSLLPCILHSRARRSSIPPLLVFTAVREAHGHTLAREMQMAVYQGLKGKLCLFG